MALPAPEGREEMITLHAVMKYLLIGILANALSRGIVWGSEREMRTNVVPGWIPWVADVVLWPAWVVAFTVMGLLLWARIPSEND